MFDESNQVKDGSLLIQTRHETWTRILFGREQKIVSEIVWYQPTDMHGC